MKQFYQLVAEGVTEFLEHSFRKVYSRRIFSDYETLENFKDEFIELATTPQSKADLSCLSKDHDILVGVVVLEYYEGGLI